MTDDAQRSADLVELHALCARYMSYTSRFVQDQWLDVFTPDVEFEGDRASGKQHFAFIDQQTHAMRLGWYNDEYVRTPDGWRIRRRATTFMRKHGGFDSGHQHDPLAASE